MILRRWEVEVRSERPDVIDKPPCGVWHLPSHRWLCFTRSGAERQAESLNRRSRFQAPSSMLVWRATRNTTTEPDDA